MKKMIPAFLDYFEKNCSDLLSGIDAKHDFDDQTEDMLRGHFGRWAELAESV